MLTRRTLLTGLAATGVLAACGRRGGSSAGTTSSTTSAPTTTTTIGPPTTTVAARWDPAALQVALDYARDHHSDAMVVTVGGEVVAEGSWAAADPRRDIASAQKSVTALLVGIAQERGLLDIGQPVAEILGPGWSHAGDDESAITVRHLLTMTSGLSPSMGFAAPAGTRWRYDNSAYHLLHPVLEAASGQTLAELSEAWMFAPIGMRAGWYQRPDAVAEHADPMGRRFQGLLTSAPDLARFGQLVLDRGRAGSTTVLGDTAYLDAAISPSQDLNPSYGYLWWLNGQPSIVMPNGRQLDRALIPSAPADLVAALGANDQKCYVVPSEELVVTRIGTAAAEGAAALSDFDDQLWQRIMAARQPA